MDIQKLKALLAKVEKSKKIIAKERDKLRDIHSELETVLESLDNGISNIENGAREIEMGIDDISGHL